MRWLSFRCLLNVALGGTAEPSPSHPRCCSRLAVHNPRSFLNAPIGRATIRATLVLNAGGLAEPPPSSCSRSRSRWRSRGTGKRFVARPRPAQQNLLLLPPPAAAVAWPFTILALCQMHLSAKPEFFVRVSRTSSSLPLPPQPQPIEKQEQAARFVARPRPAQQYLLLPPPPAAAVDREVGAGGKVRRTVSSSRWRSASTRNWVA